jgi:hypothetical protein
MKDKKRQEARELFDQIREILNEWDFLGSADVVDDEYDCMISPLTAMLLKGSSKEELESFLRKALAEHFGMEHYSLSSDLRSVALKLALLR